MQITSTGMLWREDGCIEFFFSCLIIILNETNVEYFFNMTARKRFSFPYGPIPMLCMERVLMP